MVQRWRPDTCGCVILEEHGTSAYISHEFVCPEHQGLTPAELAIHPLDNNRRKNHTEGEFMSRLPSTLTTTDAEGNIVYKNGIKFNWSFSGVGKDRVLTVNYTGVTLTNPQKNTLQGVLDTRFGVGKVVIG